MGEMKTIGYRLFWPVLVLLVSLVVLVLGGVYSALDRNGFFTGPRLGVVNIQGVIKDSEPVLRWIAELEEHPGVAGVLVRIESGGGAVVPSQEIYQAVKRLAKSKPVVASMGGAAASGGYYVAVGAPYIVANPATLTGSIGVKMQFSDLSGLMQHVGVGSQVLTSGNLKDAGSPFRPMLPEEKAYLEELMQDMFTGFVEDVAEGRKLPPADVRKLADGRAFTGRQALQLKLVDALGDKDFALRELARRCKLPSLPSSILEGPEEKPGFWERALESTINELGRAAAAKVEAGAAQPYRFYF